VLSTERAGQGPPVVLVHGFTQTGRSWLPVAERLSTLHAFTLVDLPGHGGSSGVRAGLWETAEQVASAGGRAAYVGYSLGGRVSLHLALSRPELVGQLVLVGATAGLEDDAERQRRRDADGALAERLEAEGVEPFVRWWLSQPLFATLADGAAGLDGRLVNSPEGLASSLRLAGLGTQEPLWDRLGQLDMPVLVLAGELDTRFAALARRLTDAIGPNAELVLVPGAGHACHLERPDAFCLTLADFLADTAG
jgi:2-succinyl-6-hydroxy-2,4-cyclohexadiene-1-carboxylate synthase